MDKRVRLPESSLEYLQESALFPCVLQGHKAEASIQDVLKDSGLLRGYFSDKYLI